jgi:hypothetical protein
MTIPAENQYPRRLLLLKRLTAVLQGITPGNDFPFDLSASVFRGKSVYSPDSSPLPMLSILESGRPDSGLFAGTTKQHYSETWDLLLQGFAQNDQANPTDPAHWLFAAVQERLLVITAQNRHTGQGIDPVSYMLGGLLSDFLVGPPVVRPPDNQVSSTAFFYLPLRAVFQTDNTTPYITAE